MDSKVESFIVYGGLGLAYLKTSEAMVAYAPKGIFGWQSAWVSFLWAYLAGALVEGVLYVAYRKFKERGKDNVTRVLAVAVAAISIGFSITMNQIDTAVNNGTLQSLAQPGSPLEVLHNVVFMIPLIAAVLFMTLSAVDAVIDDHFAPGQRPAPRPAQNQGQHPPAARWQGVPPTPPQNGNRPALGEARPRQLPAGGSDESDSDTGPISAVGRAEAAKVRHMTTAPRPPRLVGPESSFD